MANSVPVRRGDTVARTFVLKESKTGPVIDLTGSVMRMNIRIDHFDGVLVLTAGSGLTVVPAEGKVTFALTEDQTKQLMRGSKSEFELKRRIGDSQETVLVGAFSMTEAINPND